MRQRAIFLIIFILGLCSILTALDPERALTQYKLDIWNVDRGFPQNTIFAVVQTRDGYIWLGTQDGLVRFDGIRFKVFNKSNTPSIKDNYIRSLYEDQNGRLWIGLRDGGLSCFEEGKFTVYDSTRWPGLNDVYRIAGDREGSLWVGARNSGLTLFREGKLKTFTTGNGLAGNRVRDICQDSSGGLWVGTGAGLSYRTPSGNFTSGIPEAAMVKGFVYSIYESRDKTLWISNINGLYRKTGREMTRFDLSSVLLHPKVLAMYEDSDGNFWLGTDGSGVIRMRDGRFEPFNPDNRPADSNIYAICEDREGSVWYGTQVEGLHRLRDTTVAMFSPREGLAHEVVNSVGEDRRGNLLVTTQGGINTFAGKKLVPFLTSIKELQDGQANYILEDTHGTLWIATDGGLIRFKSGETTRYTTREGLSHDEVNYVYEDTQGNIWCGTLNGLNRFTHGRFTTFDKQDGLVYHAVNCIYQDSRRNLWIGTEGGLCKYNNGRFTSYTTQNGLPSNHIESIYGDSAGTLYLCTRGGLCRMDGDKITNYTSRHGLPGSMIYHVIDDGMGYFWLSGPSGISRVSKQEINDIAEGKSTMLHPTTFTEADGMKTRWCNSSAVKSRDGRLWFATDKGLVMIDPTNIQKNTLPPPVVIEELFIDGEERKLRRNHTDGNTAVTVEPGKERLEFFYTGLSFIKPRQMTFKIKLDGYDRDWLDRGNARSIAYTHLSPGTYTFRVRACNSDGVWNNAGASLTVVMKPYFYQTPFFYIAVILSILFAIFSGYRFRVRRLEAREKELSALVALRTETLNDRTLQLERAHRIIDEKNQNMVASIRYARRIQQATLPTDQRIAEILEDYFILFKPRDIVSGDFYWVGQSGDNLFIAVVDCTGHGVPGAFLSMIGNMELNEILNEGPVADPAQLLVSLHLRVRSALKQENGERMSDDGMDVAVIMVNPSHNKIVFAGANRPLYYVTDAQFSEVRGDRRPIGGRQKEEQRTFTNHDIQLKESITLYLTSDGFADQNNYDDERYGSPRLKRFLESHAHLGMTEQKEALSAELSAHRDDVEQRDDVTIVGVKLRDKG